MNRLKVWVYALVVLVAGAADVVFLSRWLTERAVAQADRELLSAAGQIDARLQLIMSEASQLAEVVAHEPTFTQAAAPEAALAAMQARQRSSGGDAARPVLVATAARTGVTARAAGAPVQLEADGAAIVANGVEARREGYAFAEDALWYVAAVPAGPAAAVAIGLPLDASWLALLRAATGCGATLSVEGRKPRTTLSPADLEVVLDAAKGAMSRPASAGALAAQPAAFSAPVKLPALTVPFAEAPAFRVRAVPLRGLPGAAIVLSAATAPLLAPVASYLWIALAVAALLFALGVLTGLAVTNEQRAVVPKELVAAADRIARGDFGARVPALAGSLGSVSAALNRAAEAAQGRAAAPGSPAAGSGPDLAAPAPIDLPAPLARPASAERTEAAADPFAMTQPLAPARPPEEDAAPPPPIDEVTAVVRPLAAERETSSAPREEAAPFEGLEAAARLAEPAERKGPVEAPPASQATSGTEPFAGALPGVGEDDGLLRAIRSDASAVAGQPEAGTEDLFPLRRAPAPVRPADPLAAPLQPAPAEPAAPPAAANSPAAPAAGPASAPEAAVVSPADEAHWRAVYDDFVRVRTECGEGPQGVAFDRFRKKLLKNREQLLEKYRCRTVRFQVYVKEGKAALKATPVR